MWSQGEGDQDVGLPTLPSACLLDVSKAPPNIIVPSTHLTCHQGAWRYETQLAKDGNEPEMLFALKKKMTVN